MKIGHVTFGLSHSPAAYTDRETGLACTIPPKPDFCVHEFIGNDAGELVHMMDNKVRAIVPPEGFAEYQRTWPDAAVIIGRLLGGKAGAAVAAVGAVAGAVKAAKKKPATKRKKK